MNRLSPPLCARALRVWTAAICVIGLAALLTGCALVSKSTSLQTKEAFVEESFKQALATFDRFDDANLLTDAQWAQVAVQRERGNNAIKALRNLPANSADRQALIDTLQDVVDVLAGIQTTAVPPTTKPILIRPVAHPLKRQYAGGEGLVAFEIITALLGALKVATGKAQQATNEGRDLTAEEIAEIQSETDLAVIASRAHDARHGLPPASSPPTV